MDNTAHDLNALAGNLGYTSFEQAKIALERGAPTTAHEKPARVKAQPRALWEDRKGTDAKLSPPEFIAKHYAAEMAAGTLHRGVIAKEDKPLAVKLASWLRTHDMPEGVDIPTLPEWITRQAEAGKAKAFAPAGTEGRRIYTALWNRRRRAERREANL